MYKFIFLGLCFFCGLLACKNDKPETTAASPVSENSATEDNQTQIDKSNELYARLDRLRIRLDSTMNARTAITISEGDTLDYLGQASSSRIALQLRGKYYYEPWLKVRHRTSNKVGWVYGGAVSFQSPLLKEDINRHSAIYKEIYADDIEWEGTIPTSWASAGITDPLSFKIFYLNFKKLVKNNEVLELAKLVKYPIKNIADRKAFEQNYNRIFTPELKATIEAQRLDRIYRDTKGVVLGDRAVIFKQFGSNFKIVDLKFKGLEDLALESMEALAGTYVANTMMGPLKIKAFNIRKYLELSLRKADGSQSMSLGKYLLESAQNGDFVFKEETTDEHKRKLLFVRKDSLVTLELYNTLQPSIEGELFRAIN